MHTSANTGSLFPPHDDDLLYFTLPGLLSEHRLLVVDRHLHIASLLHAEADRPSLDGQVHFTATGMLVLVPILQAYPTYAPYGSLVSHLFPSVPLEQCYHTAQLVHTREYQLFMKPLRRTVSGLSHGLHDLGLEVCSVRITGYFLKQHGQAPLLH